MNNAYRPSSTFDHPAAMILWSLLVATITIFLAFELLPLPRHVPATTEMEFGQEGEWARVSLPDNWRSFPARTNTEGIYRLSIDQPDRSGDWAIFIPNHSGQISVKLNGIELLQGGSFSGELAADQGVPFYAPLPIPTGHPGPLPLEITLKPGGQLIGFLSEIYLGPADQLKPSFDWFFARAVIIPILVLVWQILLAALLLLLWVFRRQERAALICGLLLLFSGVHGLPILLPSQIGLTQAVTMFGLVTNFWLSVLGLLFTYELSERRFPFKEAYILIPPAIATLAFLLLPTPVFRYVDLALVVPFSLIVSAWIVYVLVRASIWEKRWEAQVLSISILGACSLAVHDTLVLMNVTPNWNFLHFRIVYLLILPALSLIFALRLISSMNHVETLANTLEDRVQQKENQLREAFERRNLLEGKQVLDEERRRIMRDMHDGLGGQLMSIIAMSGNRDAPPEAIENSARAALDDLRTMINSLSVDEDITGILGTFRERAEQQLSLAGMELDWKMVELPPIEGLTPTSALHILRILQEAVTNAAKHSGATKVTIRFAITEAKCQRLRIEIEDNGRGLRPDAPSGQGLKNMRARADSLNAELSVDFAKQGTIASLSIPTCLGSRG